MIAQFIWTIWTLMSSVPKKADKLNLSLSVIRILFIYIKIIRSGKGIPILKIRASYHYSGNSYDWCILHTSTSLQKQKIYGRADYILVTMDRIYLKSISTCSMLHMGHRMGNREWMDKVYKARNILMMGTGNSWIKFIKLGIYWWWEQGIAG